MPPRWGLAFKVDFIGGPGWEVSKDDNLGVGDKFAGAGHLVDEMTLVERQKEEEPKASAPTP